jgi:hypothetical protein
MNLQHVTLREMKPRQHEEFVASHNPPKPLRYLRHDLQPGFRRAFVSLTRRSLKLGQLRAHKPNRLNRINGCAHIASL